MAQENLQIVIEAVNRAERELKSVGNQLNTLTGAAQGAGGGAASAALSFTKMAGAIAAGIGVYNLAANAISGITRSIKNFVREGIELGFQYERNTAALEQMRIVQGRSTEEINNITNAIIAEGKSMAEAVHITKAMVGANFSEAEALALVAAARDTAAFAQISSSQANEMLIESIRTLNPSLLKELGIFVNLNTVYKEAAAELGIAASAMTTAQKQQALLNAALNEATAFAGQYDASMGTTGKKLNSLEDALKSTKVAVGIMLNEALKPMVNQIYDIVKALNTWIFTTDEGKKFMETLSALIASVVVPVFQAMIGIIMGTVQAYMALARWLQDTGLIDMFRMAWENLVDVYVNNLQPAIQELWIALQPFLPLLVKLAELFGTMLVAALLILIQTLTVLLKFLADVITVMAGIAETITTTLQPAINTVIGFFDNMISTIRSAINWINKLIAKMKEVPRVSLGGLTKGIMGFAEGGVVPGPTGAAVPAIVHGGEKIIPPGQSGNRFGGASIGGISVTVNGNISSQADARELAERIGDNLMRRLKSQARV